MADPRFREAIRRKLKKRARLPRSPRVLHPDSQTRQYQAALRAMIEAAKRIVEKRVIPILPSAIRQREFPLPDAVKQDAWSDDITDAFKDSKEIFTREYTQEEIRSLARKYGMTVAEFNTLQLEKAFRRVVGVDVFASEPWLVPQIQAFTAQNVSLISSMSETLFSDLEAGVFQRMATGSRFEELASWIEERFGMAERKANLIARDQVSKLNGQLAGLRQTNAGVKRYIWRTSQDERVRDSHRVKEGKEYSWDDPPADTGHPGEDINCRCWAEPVFESVVEGEADFESGVGSDR